MKHIFEGNWIYLAHESQVPNPGDYFTTYIGRQPVVITRDKDGQLHCLINACAHRGAMICRRKTDNRMTLTCPFHGWTFRNDGSLLKVKDPDGAGYPETFNSGGSHNMTKVARFDSYRGFLFGSLNADVLPLSGHLGDTHQGHRHAGRPVPGRAGGAARLVHIHLRRQLEGAGGERRRRLPRHRHPLELRRDHQPPQYRRVEKRDQSPRRRRLGQVRRRLLVLPPRPPVPVDLGSQPAGPAAVGQARRPQGRRFGDAKGEFMVKGSRNLCLYPNVYVMDQFSTQIRHFRPIAPDKTEVTIYCIAPKGESDEARSHRIRQYEDFFNASGMATPDDLEEFRSCQLTFRAQAAPWNDMSRGARALAAPAPTTSPSHWT